jgi:hypothetical protein
MGKYARVTVIPRLRMSETTGRPLGNPDWISDIEARTGRTLAP